MPQGQFTIQEQVERQLQKLTPQQLLTARLVELSIVELEDRVKTEGYDNVALEEGHDDEGDRNEEGDVTDEGIQQMDSDDNSEDFSYSEDDIPVYTPTSGRNYEETMPIGDTKSFIEDLKRQVYDFNITPKQQELIEYLIGTLDDRGFIDRPLSSIADDLLFQFNIDADLAEVEEAMKILQQFEPAGIGARNLQECLTIQLDRKLENCTDAVRKARLQLERDIIQNHFDVLQHQNTEQLVHLTQASHEQVARAMEGIRKLNPRPGLALSESADERAQTIDPDFIIETTPDGTISVELNHGEVPELRISPNYENQLLNYQKHADKMTHAQQEAFEYTRQKVEGAKMFIEAIKQRQKTLYITMKAIVKLQKDFILTQDESLLRPMRLVDVAQLTGQDISTVSRVKKGKYVLIDGQLYALDFFFLRTRTNADGETLEHKTIKERIREIIEQEDKSKPVPDQKIVEKLLAEGHNISRRTVAKYRSEMGIPSTSERRRV